MIQTTRPPAASRKWLRISGGRIRLPASCCWRIPPRINQIESSTKPPPAVITQAISAAHFITPPLDRRSERDARSRRGVYTSRLYLSSIASAQCQQDAALCIVTLAVAGLAGELVEPAACERPG